MLKRFLILFLLLFSYITCHSQTHRKYDEKELEVLKEKFYLNRKIGVDSSLYYMNKMLNTNIASYKTFAYSGIEYLKTREKKFVDIQFYKDSIEKYLPQISKTEKNYTILFDIHILLGNTNKRRKLIKAALHNYIKAENYALQSNDIERIIKIKGNIALIYQDMKELNKAIKETKETLKLIEENKKELGKKYITNKYKTALNVGAIYATLYKNDIKNDQYADSSLSYYNSLLINKEIKLSPYYFGRIYYSLGTVYSLKKEYTKAGYFLDKSLTIFNKNKSDSYLYKGYYNAGFNYYMANDIEKAKQSFLIALRVKKDTLLDANYMNMHNYLSKIYSKQQKNDSANYYLNTFLKINGKVFLRDKQQFKEAYKVDKETSFDKEINKLTNDNSKKTYYYNTIVIGLTILLSIISFIVFKNIKEKIKTKKRLDELLDKISKKETIKGVNPIHTSNLSIKDEKHQEIINGLLKIEKKLYFLKEEFNLYNAAKKIGTNTTYLSKVIKEYKLMSFSEYTNELRINYIITTLSNDKKIRAYTTQAIGEIGGYKNAKSFTRIFKNYTGITPYQFIEKIDKELISKQ
jgi:AraC-like DNA-binding protein